MTLRTENNITIVKSSCLILRRMSSRTVLILFPQQFSLKPQHVNFFKISHIAYLWLHGEHNIASRSILIYLLELNSQTTLTHWLMRNLWNTDPVSNEGLWELARNWRLWGLGLKVARSKTSFFHCCHFPFWSLKSCRFLWGRIQRFQKMKHGSLIICYFTLMDAFYYNVGTGFNFQTVKSILNIFLYPVKQLI